MKALVLAAGYATRLYPLTKEFPKPLLEVSGRPIIDYIIDKLSWIDEIDEIIVVTNSKFISHFRSWAKRLNVGKRLTLVDDFTKSIYDRRGAIGDMDFAVKKRRIKDDLLIIGGDNLFNGYLEGFLSFAKSKQTCPVIGAYKIKHITEARKYGVIKLDRKNKVVDFQEKPERPNSPLVAMCLYYFPRARLKLIKEYLDRKGSQNDAMGFYIDWLRRKVAVYAFVFTGRWYDIGHHKFYNEAKKEFFTPHHRKPRSREGGDEWERFS